MPARTAIPARILALTAAVTAVLLGFAAPASAAVVPATLVQSVSTNQTTAATSITQTGVDPTAAGQVLLAFLATDGPAGGGQSFSTVTGCGATWSLVKRANAQPGAAEIWQAATANGNVCSVTATRQSGSYQGHITVAVYSGGSVGVSAGASGGTGAAQVALNGLTSGSGVRAVGSDWTSATSRTLLANQTSVAQLLAPAGDTFWVQKFTDTANTPANLTVGTSAPGGTRQWNIAAVEIKGVDGTPPPPAAACGDGVDNDGDTKVDFPADPGCTSATDTDETDVPPPTTTTPPPPPPAVCADGLDNDGDTKTDFPADPGCSSATDTDEADPVTPPPGGQACPALPAFPDANCTGVPAGTALATVNGNLTTTANNQVIDAKLITGDLVVRHNGVTVTNSRIKGRVDYASANRDLTLRDVDLGPDACPSSSNGGTRLIGGADYTLTRAHLHHNAADLVLLTGDPNTSILIEDSLVNQPCFYPSDHLDAIQLYDPGAVAKVTIRHSNVDTRPVNSTDKGNAAVFWADNPGAGSTLLVQGSKLAGGQVTLALYDAVAGSKVVLEADGNTFVRNSMVVAPCSRGSGPVSVPFNGTEGVKFTNNTWDDGTAVTC